VLAAQPDSGESGKPVRYLLNTFKRYSRADAYVSSLQRMAPGLEPKLIQHNNNFVVLLEQDLSDFDRLRLSRMVDLTEMY